MPPTSASALRALPIALAVLASAPATAAAAGPFTLRDAIARAAAANPDLLRERASVAAATANVTAALGQFDLKLNAHASFVRSPVPSLTCDVSDLTESFAADVGLERAIETGGLLSLTARELDSLTNARFQFDPMTGTCIQVPIAPYHSGNLTLAFTQPLLRGFGTEVTLANLRKQRILRDRALLDREARAAVVLRDVVSAYWELAYAADNLVIQRSAVTLAEEQRKATQAQVDVGRLGALELAAVDRAIADRQIDVAVGEQGLLGRALDLEHLLGRPIPSGFTPTPAADRPSTAAVEIDDAAETTRALAASPQLRSLRAGETLSEIDVATAEALLRPQLDFTASAGTVGRALDSSTTWTQVARGENLAFAASLAFQYPLQNRAARGAAGAARAAGDRARIDAADLELGIRDGVVRQAAAARTAARRHALAVQAVGYAGKNLEAERARFEVGRSTNNDVLLRQQELKNAEIQVARAAADQAIAEAALAALTGEILDRYGVVLPGSD